MNSFLQLCVGGSWIDTVTVELDPLDAGTDNGFTFTAPNWPTAPQGVIYRITSRYPAHPAGSFYYPKSKRLPPIATFQFIKVGEGEKERALQQYSICFNKLINCKLAVKMLPHLHIVPPYNPNEFSCTAKKPKKKKKNNENWREKNQSANEPLTLQWPPKTCVMASSVCVCV